MSRASAPTVPGYSSWELQPGVNTIQPSIDSSYRGSAIKKSPTSSSATVVATSSTQSQPATTTATSGFSLISLIPGPTGTANETSATGTATAPHPSCSDKSPFTIGVSTHMLFLPFQAVELTMSSSTTYRISRLATTPTIRTSLLSSIRIVSFTGRITSDMCLRQPTPSRQSLENSLQYIVRRMLTLTALLTQVSSFMENLDRVLGLQIVHTGSTHTLCIWAAATLDLLIV